MKESPQTVGALRAAKYNPRRINPEAAAALSKCMKQFGDLSGLVFNIHTGHMVTGHQRKTQLPKDARIVRTEDATDKVGTIGYGYAQAHGTQWRVRFVDWPEAREKAANVAANSPLLAGSFNEGLKDLLAEIDTELPDLAKALRLDDLILTPVDRDLEWQGMPECHQEDQTAFRSLLVHFSAQKKVDAFSRLVNQTITKETRSLWYPKAARKKAHDKRYADES